MPLTAHDAEERSRQLIGHVLDAREKVADTQDHALDGPSQARDHLVALRELTDRQDDLIAELREQVRQAIERDPINEQNDRLRNGYVAYVARCIEHHTGVLPYETWLNVAEEVNR